MAKITKKRKPTHRQCKCERCANTVMPTPPIKFTPEMRAMEAEGYGRAQSERANAYREAMLILTGQYKSQPLPY